MRFGNSTKFQCRFSDQKSQEGSERDPEAADPKMSKTAKTGKGGFYGGCMDVLSFVSFFVSFFATFFLYFFLYFRIDGNFLVVQN